MRKMLSLGGILAAVLLMALVVSTVHGGSTAEAQSG